MSFDKFFLKEQLNNKNNLYSNSKYFSKYSYELQFYITSLLSREFFSFFCLYTLDDYTVIFV
jgi:hypothetical protein